MNFNLQIINFKDNKGFTLIEIVIVITILAIISTIVISNFFLWTKKTDVNNTIQEFANILRLAQNRTLSSEGDSQYGVYINTVDSPYKYILFKGTSYDTRDSSFDQVSILVKTVEFFNISLGGGNEIVFSKLSGASVQSGSVSIRSKSDTSQIKTVYIENSGTINFSSVSAPSDSSRTKDSRHVHIDYSRTINTATENITLNFDDGVVIQTFPINAYLIGDQINWLGTFSVSGSNQTVKIHTHRLNSTDTQFSVHRNGTLNNKSLKITISDDTSGNLVNYSADGKTLNGLTSTNCYSGGFDLSVNVSNCTWQ